MKRAFLVLPLLAALLLIGCDDAVTDSNSRNDGPSVTSAEVLNEATFGKKGGNDKGGGKPDNGGGSTDAFPTYSNISVATVEADKADGWYNSGMYVPPIVDGNWPVGIPDASDFFGCPDDLVACYEITITLDEAAPEDLVAVRIFPFEEDIRCSSDGFTPSEYACPVDSSLDDGTTNPPRRALSLFDDYVGTPYVLVSEFSADGLYKFYWQGQALRRYYDGTWKAEAYYRFDRDPDDAGPDLLRAQAVFIDASSPNTYDGASLKDIDGCSGISASAGNSTDCVFRHQGASSDTAIKIGFDSISNGSRARGRSKEVSTTFYVTHHLAVGETVVSNEVRADRGSDVWAVYLIDNIPVDGPRVRTIEANSNNLVPVSAQPGCVMIRPIQAELFANGPNEFSAAFSAENDGFEQFFTFDSSGTVTEDPSCAVQYQ